MLSRVFMHRSNLKFKDIISQIVSNYNSRIHKAHGMSPNQASLDVNHERVWQALYAKERINASTPKFKVGQKVRISLTKKPFEKGMQLLLLLLLILECEQM